MTRYGLDLGSTAEETCQCINLLHIACTASSFETFGKAEGCRENRLGRGLNDMVAKWLQKNAAIPRRGQRFSSVLSDDCNKTRLETSVTNVVFPIQVSGQLLQ